MIDSTWKEDPEKRPSFTDIMCFLYQQNVEDTPINESNSIVDTENDSGYLEIFTQTVTVVT